MRGSILVEQAYAQGKMLDHSAWSLPRNISLSDIDAVVDSNGSILFAELSSRHREWGSVPTGQRRLHESLVRGGPHISVLCFHAVGVERPIDTKSDIQSFQPMLWDHGLIVCPPLGRWAWEKFVTSFVDSPLKSRRRIIAASIQNPSLLRPGNSPTEPVKA